MITGGCISVVGAGNITYTKGHAASSPGKVAFCDSTLSVARGGAGSCAGGTAAPCASDSGIGYRIVICIMYSDGNSGCPSVAL